MIHWLCQLVQWLGIPAPWQICGEPLIPPEQTITAESHE